MIASSAVKAAYTQAFLDAFSSLGIDPWAGIEMDVAWGQTTLRYGLHRPSVTGPIFVCRVCTSLPQDAPTRMQVLSHADLSPDSVTPLAQAAVSVQNPPSGSQTCFRVVRLGRSGCEHVSAVFPFP